MAVLGSGKMEIKVMVGLHFFLGPEGNKLLHCQLLSLQPEVRGPGFFAHYQLEASFSSQRLSMGCFFSQGFKVKFIYQNVEAMNTCQQKPEVGDRLCIQAACGHMVKAPYPTERPPSSTDPKWDQMEE